ncbi:argininosuccinate synthase [Candidatus Cetobacterium colombiensis]|uniref:Argininosuccinate synthase n=1 Tax=Candidatus Cetobacterium colombiensis TaxID=3073100 RepID=A0ABU4WD28_9FUSO|nr:argininosuccinate synthase [Candidatus Cetobacterium colombiensis]MDX8337441.1 argininosuccinate synthase [Candidatus Cetobacterium colombiensis]
MVKEKVILAYSGGLDTSVIVPWLKENYDYEVIAVAVNVGQNEDFKAIEEKAYLTGASKFYLINKVNEFVEEYIFPTLKAGAIYENKYLLGTSMARPVIGKALVEVAHIEGAKYIAHGATGKGNDQVRFELAIKALDPSLKIIAPWRIWDIKSREEEIEYLEKNGISLPFHKKSPYSRDENLFHVSHEGFDLESPSKEPNYENILQWVKTLEAANEKSEYITIEFVKGVPIAINGEKMSGVEIIKQLNKIGGNHGIGVLDMVENRLVGMKSRGIYETPGGTILFFAHEELERLCLDKDTYQEKIKLSHDFSKLVYNGQWFTTLRKAITAFVDVTQEFVTGEVKLKLYKGNIILAGTTSPFTLYSEEYSTFEKDSVYNQQDAEGFINLFGLPIKIEALLRKKNSFQY